MKKFISTIGDILGFIIFILFIVIIGSFVLPVIVTMVAFLGTVAVIVIGIALLLLIVGGLIATLAQMAEDKNNNK